MSALDAATTGPYNLFLLLAFVVGFGVAWQQARRLELPSVHWLLTLALAAAAGIAGSRVLHFDPGAPAGAKTILGGVLLATVALFASIRALRLDPRAADALALALPLGFAVGRIGCLLAGCCFGHLTDLPWGAIYDEHSAAFRTQLAAGLIDADSTASLPVHPTQLYEAALGLLIAGAVPGLRRFVRRPGSLLLAVLLGLSLGRLSLEFFRSRDLVVIAGLTQVQWTIATISGLLFMLLVRRERGYAPSIAVQRTAQAGPPPTARVVLLAFLLGLPLLTGGLYFAPIERLLLILVAAAPVAALIATRAGVAAPTRHAFGTPGVIACSLFVIALQQDLPRTAPDTTRPHGVFPRSGWSFGLSGGTMEDRDTRVTGVRQGDCGPVNVWEEFVLRYSLAGASASYIDQPSSTRATTIRLRGFAGTERAESLDASPSPGATTVHLAGGGISATFDWSIVGITGGVAGGRFVGDTAASSLLGTVGARLGSLHGPHLFAAVNDMEPLGGPSYARVGAGYGFGDSGSSLYAGLLGKSDAFVGASVASGPILIEPFAAVGDSWTLRLSVRSRLPDGRPRM
jgi:hypothetical protein